jgi:hypothetical protein
MRDQFLAGIDRDTTAFSSEGPLLDAFIKLNSLGLLQKAVDEKYEAVSLWKKIVFLSTQVKMSNKADESYLKISSQYGLILHQIIAAGWNVMAIGFKGDETGKYDIASLRTSLVDYDRYWKKFKQLKKNNAACATLYQPYAFRYIAPYYHGEKGMGASVNKYRKLLSQ